MPMFQIVVIKRFRLIFAECLNKNFKKRLRVYFSFMNTFTYRSILSLNSFFFFFSFRIYEVYKYSVQNFQSFSMERFEYIYDI